MDRFWVFFLHHRVYLSNCKLFHISQVPSTHHWQQRDPTVWWCLTQVLKTIWMNTPKTDAEWLPDSQILHFAHGYIEKFSAQRQLLWRIQGHTVLLPCHYIPVMYVMSCMGKILLNYFYVCFQTVDENNIITYIS